MSREMMRVTRTVEVIGEREALDLQVKNSLAPGFRWIPEGTKGGKLGIHTGSWSAPAPVSIMDGARFAGAPDQGKERGVYPPGEGYNGDGALGPVSDNPVKWWLQLELNTETGTIVGLRSMTDREPSTIGPTRFALALPTPLTWEQAQRSIAMPGMFDWCGTLTVADDGTARRTR